MMPNVQAPLDFQAYVAQAYSTLTDRLKSLPKVTIAHFKAPGRASRPISCIYLIWAPDGELLYVGKTANLRNRLRGHLTSRGLLSILAEALGLRTRPTLAHRCTCGRFLECRQGQDMIAGPEELIRLKDEVEKSYLVSYIGIPPRSAEKHQLEFERYVQWVLKPRYGWDRLEQRRPNPAR